jgi:hypothetical protein
MIGKEVFVANLKVVSELWLDTVKKTTKKLCQDSHILYWFWGETTSYHDFGIE